MITVVVVYNNEKILNEILLKSLENQIAKFELIKVNNTKNKYKSAAEALNYGAKKVQGKYIMFIHQDVELDSEAWLKTAEAYLDKIPNLGIAGVAGMSNKGKNREDRTRGYINNCGNIWGSPLEKPEEVQTLDELLLIVPKMVFDKLQFDEKNFNYWHYYGADFCLSLREMGLKSYVIPLFVYHKSPLTNRKRLLIYQKRLYNKHRKNFTHIFTTTGVINASELKNKAIKKILYPPYKILLRVRKMFLKRN